MRVIDGSTGEGGGQILRTALFLSVLTGQSIRVEKIRSGRSKPGLKPQHVGVLRLLEEVTGADALGAAPGSSRVEFHPAVPRPGHYRFDVGTAGSLALFLQTLLPVCLASPGAIRLDLVGGTDVRGGPTIEWVRRVLIPRLAPLALRLDLECIQHGFEPAGGGQVRLEVEPRPGADTLAELRRLVLERLGPPVLARGDPVTAGGTSIAHESLRGASVAQRVADSAAATMETDGLPRPKIETFSVPAASAGASVTLWVEDSFGVRLGSDGLGRRGVPAEDVGRRAAQQLAEDWRSGATVDRHLADHLVPWVALGMGSVRVPFITGHLETNVWVCQQMLGPDAVRLDGQILVTVPHG